MVKNVGTQNDDGLELDLDALATEKKAANTNRITGRNVGSILGSFGSRLSSLFSLGSTPKAKKDEETADIELAYEDDPVEKETAKTTFLSLYRQLKSDPFFKDLSNRKIELIASNTRGFSESLSFYKEKVAAEIQRLSDERANAFSDYEVENSSIKSEYTPKGTGYNGNYTRDHNDAASQRVIDRFNANASNERRFERAKENIQTKITEMEAKLKLLEDLSDNLWGLSK